MKQNVIAIWEGSGNDIALDVLRALVRDPDSLHAFDAEVSRAEGGHPLLYAHLERTRAFAGEMARLAAAGEAAAQVRARALVEDLDLALQASLLLRYAHNSVSSPYSAHRSGT